MLKYRLKRIPKKKLIIWTTMLMLFVISLGSIVGFYAVNNAYADAGPSIINGDTVYVNDLLADWNYYEGLNYTEIQQTNVLPGMNNDGNAAKSSEIYSLSSLVAVKITYDSADINNDSLVGEVSDVNNEDQEKFIYYKYYPLVNDNGDVVKDGNSGKIVIELIDNPWTSRPVVNNTYYGFNGWVCDETGADYEVPCSEVVFSYDYNYYVRYVTIPLSAVTTVDGEKMVSISLKTSWTPAATSTVANNSISFNSFKTNMQQIGTSTINNVTSYYFNDGQSTLGYYYKMNASSMTSDRSLYYDSTGKACNVGGSCGGTVYKLIQPSDSFAIYKNDRDSNGDGVNDYSSIAGNYYYLATRDTNLFMSNNTTVYLYNTSVQLYRNRQYQSYDTTAPFTITDSVVSLRSTFKPKNDFGIDNSTVNSANTYVTTQTGNGNSRSTSDLFDSNGSNVNLKIGRNISTSSDYFTATAVIGGHNNKVIVESGTYHYLKALPSSGKSDNHTVVIYGSDYDRVTNANTKLKVAFQALSSDNGTYDSDTIVPASEMIIKSGTFGSDLLIENLPHSSYYTYGIYAGGISGGSTSAFRTLKIEGGNVFSVNGGPCIPESSKSQNIIGIYVTGGRVDNIVGGAGASTTYGNRIISVTGGTVNNSVAGGSNSYTSSGATPGPMTGNTLVYVGGDAVLGDKIGYNYTNDSATILYGVTERGSVFGAGLGRPGDDYTDLGRVTNSHVIINGGTINGSVYGGGNFGSVGTDEDFGETKAVVDILFGNIKGSVFGAANENGAGYDIRLLKNDYYIKKTVGQGTYMPGGVYFRKRLSGNSYRISLLGTRTQCSNSNYTSGSNYRRNCEYYEKVSKDTPYNEDTTYYFKSGSDDNATFSEVIPETYVPVEEEEEDEFKIVKNVYPHNIYINLNDGTINKSMYGGSNEKGEVFGNVYINLYKGNVINSGYGVYGGGKGGDTIVYGNTVIETNTNDDLNLNINEIYGGSELGTVNEDGVSLVTINGGNINTVYGGGKGGTTNGTPDPPTTNGPVSVRLLKGDVNTIFGGNNIYGTINTNIKVSVEGGNVNTVFGGSNGSGAGASKTNVFVSGGTINTAVYGGGKSATTTNSTYVNITGGTFTELDRLGNALNGENLSLESSAEIYGGGEEAAVNGTATVDIDGGVVYKVFGGSNRNGHVNNTIVNNNGGKVLCNTYGGGNVASVGVSNNNLKGTEYTYVMPDGINSYTTVCGNAFAGGASAPVGNANITLDGSSLINVYGGSDRDNVVTTSNVNIISGETVNVFGGNNYGGSTTNSNVTINETDSFNSSGNKVMGNNLKVANVFGGSNGAAASITQTSNVTIYDGVISENVYGGGNKAPVVGSTNVNVYDGVMYSVFGGGNEAHVGDVSVTENGDYITGTLQGKTTVNVIGGTINKNVYGSGNSSFVDGDTEVNIGDDALRKLNITNTSNLNLNLKISGSVFGGSETNTDGETVFDNSFIGVYDSASINIDGGKYINNNVSKLTISGSINGGGNNSMVRGVSTIYIDNYGTKNYPSGATSIQRAKNVYVTDSYFRLSGARNRASTDPYTYSLIAIDNLYLLGSGGNNAATKGSHLYLATGATYFGALYSGSMVNNVFTEQKVTEDNSGTLVRTVSDNRIYMLVNTILAVTGSSNAFASYESNTASPGEVHGMTFLGMYAGDSLENGIYDNYSDGDTYDVSLSGSVSELAYTYVYGINYSSQSEEEQIKTNGFYTNVLGEDGKKIKYQYVGVTPADATYYKWVLGDEPIEIKVDLIADKYSESGTVNKNIPIADILSSLGMEDAEEWADATLDIKSVDTTTFAYSSGSDSYQGYLIDKSDILSVNTNDANGDGVVDANNYFALSMGTTTSGWLDNYKTNFYSENGADAVDFCTGATGDCTNDSKYRYDSTKQQRSLSFWLYHSKNLDFSYIDRSTDPDNMTFSMGQIRIYVTLTNGHGDPNSALDNNLGVTIVVNVLLSDGELDKYGAIMAPGKQYEIFQGRPTVIPADGSFSIYQSLSLDLNGVKAGSVCNENWSADKLYNEAGYATVLDRDCNENTVYWSEAYRYLSSSYLLPQGTIITMLDLKTGEKYYYEVTPANYSTKRTEFQSKNLVKYYLEDFIKMGSTSTDNLFDDDMKGEDSKTYHYKNPAIGTDLAVEEFIFIVDFADADISNISASSQHSFYLQLERRKSSSANNIDSAGVAENILSTDIDKMVYTIIPSVNSTLNTTGGYVLPNGDVVPDTTIYVGESSELLLNTSLIHKDANGNVLSGVSDTKFDEYKLGAKLSIVTAKRDANDNIIEGEYEQVSTKLFGTVVTINNTAYYPQTDGSIRIELAGRITDVASSISIDFKNSGLTATNYILVVETFVSCDGLYYGDFEPTRTEYPFVLLDNGYGLDVKTETSAQVTHDVNSGEDVNGDKEIHYILDVVNGLSNPNLKISLERRLYGDNPFDTKYEIVDLTNLVEELRLGDSNTNIITSNNSCYLRDSAEKCIYYNLGGIDRGENSYNIYMKLKGGPSINDLGNNKPIANWKSGTYRVIFTLYDGDVAIGSVYEYLIIRSLGLDEIVIEGSGN